jgi:hypothetical protein
MSAEELRWQGPCTKNFCGCAYVMDLIVAPFILYAIIATEANAIVVSDAVKHGGGSNEVRRIVAIKVRSGATSRISIDSGFVARRVPVFP